MRSTGLTRFDDSPALRRFPTSVSFLFLFLLTLVPGLARAAAEVPRRPQEPRPPYPYREEEVTYANGEIKLAGTLTVPQGEGPFPAVLLITGSGAQDRDETLLGHKPFRVLADHLSRHGIAALRMDDRGVGGSTGSIWEATSADFAQDALAGVRFLRQHPKIAADRIGLLGHSEGGLVAPLAASQSPDVAFVVMLAGTGEPALEILTAQVELISRADGKPEDAIRKEVDVTRKLVQAVIDEKDPEALRAKLRELSREEAALTAKEEIEARGGLEAWLDRNVRVYSSNWFRFFAHYDPRPALRKVTVPVLAVNGALDLQVPADTNLPQIEKALKKAGNKDVAVRALPGLNHLFQPAKTGSPEEYGEIETTMAPELLDLVAGWIRERFVKPGAAK